MSALLGYREVPAARARFISALGFEEEWAVAADDGTIERSHLRLGDAVLMIDAPGSHDVQNPQDLGGITHLLVLHVAGIDAHHEVAAAAGLDVDGPPQRESWGGHSYTVTDPEGYVFQFVEA